MKRPYPHTTLYRLLAAYGDVLNRQAERDKGAGQLIPPRKIPPQTIGDTP